jgi:hypothetical protein
MTSFSPELLLVLIISSAPGTVWGLSKEAGLVSGRFDDHKHATGHAETSQLRAHEINPIFYLHVPKSGSSFATSVVHQACGDKIRDDVWVQEPSEFYENWQDSCNKSKFMRFEGGHDPLTVTKEWDLRHVVVMMRNPAQRIMSGYYHDLHDCYALRQKHNCKASANSSDLFTCDGDSVGENGRFVRDPNVISPLEYGKCVENCTGNMLTGRHCGDSGWVDVDKAVDVVRKLGFVGLTEEWSLSVCLWHRKFGGRMLPAELMNVRPGVVTSASGEATTYDVDGFFGEWQPAVDTRVYNAAVWKFWSDLQRYGVSREACESETRWLIQKGMPDLATR